MRSLGLDIGDRRIGVALSDPGGILASPLTVIARTDEMADIEAIVTIAKQNKAGLIIVGLPISMDGRVREQAEKVSAFTEKLRARIDLPIEFRDERLSTVSVKRMMQSVRRTKNTEHDAMAAALILQGYLEETRS